MLNKHNEDKTEEETKKNSKISFSIGQKILAIVGFSLFLLMSVAGTGIWQMSQIAEELEGISERGLPLTSTLMRVTTHQLEQSISLERALRSMNSEKSGGRNTGQFSQAFERFQTLAEKVDKELIEARELTTIAFSAAKTDQDKTFYGRIEKGLRQIAEQHKVFDDHVYEAFELAVADQESAMALLPGIEREEEALNKALEQTLYSVGDYAKQSAHLATEHEKSALQMLIALSLFALISCTTVSVWFVRRTIALPLQHIIRGLSALSRNDFTVELTVTSKDEIGAVAQAYGKFRQAQKDAIALKDELKERKTQAEQDRKQMMNNLADQFEQSVGGIVNTVASAATELNAAAKAMTEVSERSNNKASDIAVASQQASSNVSSIASAAKEMSASIDEISERVVDASQISVSAVNQSYGTKSEITELADKAKQISQVVSLISEIAEQTNLLALNATIEAARAGPAGKGFSVVASEVKELANQTAQATEEITKQIEAMQVATQSSVGSIDNIGKVITELNESSTAIAAAMEEQSATTKNIAQNVEEASTGTNEVTHSMNEMAASSKVTGDTAHEVLSTSGELSMMAESLKTEVEHFLSEIRAA